MEISTLGVTYTVMSESDYGKITDEVLAREKDRIGEKLDQPQPLHEEVTKDAIRHWCHGIGHENPLYTDEEYAAEGPYGEIVAPGLFLFSTCEVASTFSTGFPGVHEMWAGCEWEWHEPIRRGYEINTESWIDDVEEKETGFGGRTVVQTYKSEFYNQHDDHLATSRVWNFRMEREETRDRSGGEESYKGEEIELAYWEDEEIDEFAEHVLNEEPRGSEPRYFEDVDVGDELDTLLKGPYTATQDITFIMGWSRGWCRANGLLYELLYEQNPGLKIKNPKHGMFEPPEAVHWSDEFAQMAGVPAAYDFGPERVGWLGHVCQHWMGDHGFVEELESKIREHNLKGDVTWCSGEVVDKRVDGDEHLVDVELEAVDQRDRVTADGSAVIRLPSKE